MTSSGNFLFAVGFALVLQYCAGYVISDVIVNTRYGRLRGRRVHKDFGLGQGLICINLHTTLRYVKTTYYWVKIFKVHYSDRIDAE